MRADQSAAWTTGLGNTHATPTHTPRDMNTKSKMRGGEVGSGGEWERWCEGGCLWLVEYFFDDEVAMVALVGVEERLPLQHLVDHRHLMRVGSTH